MGECKDAHMIFFMGRYKWSLQEDILLRLLKDVRRESGLSGPVMQKMLGRPNSYIAKVESGEKRLDVLELREFCRVCGITTYEFTKRLDDRLEQILSDVHVDVQHPSSDKGYATGR